MGELFRRTIPPRSLNWTGERLLTPLTATIEDEDLHRYFVARELCRGKNVLDVASGEGYGTALLAQTALSVLGVELDQNSVEHAKRAYVSPNLNYVLGDARNLPLDSNSIDVVVSFETLEHVSEQHRFLEEVARVLKREGLLCISTPDPEVYSAPGVSPNPYHVRELTFSEFREVLGPFFEHLVVYRQRAAAGSTIWPDGVRCNAPAWIFDQRSPDTFEAHRNLPRAPYLLAVASNGPLPCFSGSFFLHSHGTAAELERLAATEDRLRREIEELSRVINKDREELSNAHEQLHNATLLSRQQALVAQRLQQEIQRFQNERQHFQEETQRRQDALIATMQSEAEESRMQTIAAQRELTECKACLARSQQVVRELSGLIVPVWFRRLLPASVRSIVRRIKGSLTS